MYQPYSGDSPPDPTHPIQNQDDLIAWINHLSDMTKEQAAERWGLPSNLAQDMEETVPISCHLAFTLAEYDHVPGGNGFWSLTLGLVSLSRSAAFEHIPYLGAVATIFYTATGWHITCLFGLIRFGTLDSSYIY